ncbi:hypothetical protein J2Z60_001252 [Lactobacillus colini]|uniref:Uncharacterized protein n=1 Tax=Lactobacillus colini TaxID=1819254 RepID=A0ABS4MEG1_9LACO|nr:hypothetical protein [Lactobacillus colini]MBP2058075.1 hypothetical protein [Lactobacillus colini]
MLKSIKRIFAYTKVQYLGEVISSGVLNTGRRLTAEEMINLSPIAQNHVQKIGELINNAKLTY